MTAIQQIVFLLLCLTINLQLTTTLAFSTPRPNAVNGPRSLPSDQHLKIHAKAPNASSTSTALSASPLVWAATTAIGGALGTPFVMRATKTWYNDIALPSFTPPNKIFAPVWTTLYSLMGIATFRIRTILLNSTPTTATAGSVLAFAQTNILTFCYMHYALNILWAPVFFGLQRLQAGHVMNILLILSLLSIMFVFGTIDILSSSLLAPYLVWLCLATRLSDSVCKLNPTTVDKFGFWCNNAKLQRMIWDLRKLAAEKVGLDYE